MATARRRCQDSCENGVGVYLASTDAHVSKGNAPICRSVKRFPSGSLHTKNTKKFQKAPERPEKSRNGVYEKRRKADRLCSVPDGRSHHLHLRLPGPPVVSRSTRVLWPQKLAVGWGSVVPPARLPPASATAAAGLPSARRPATGCPYSGPPTGSPGAAGKAGMEGADAWPVPDTSRALDGGREPRPATQPVPSVGVANSGRAHAAYPCRNQTVERGADWNPSPALLSMGVERGDCRG